MNADNFSVAKQWFIIHFGVRPIHIFNSYDSSGTKRLLEKYISNSELIKIDLISRFPGRESELYMFISINQNITSKTAGQKENVLWGKVFLLNDLWELFLINNISFMIKYKRSKTLETGVLCDHWQKIFYWQFHKTVTHIHWHDTVC